MIPVAWNVRNRYQNAGKSGNDGKGNGKRREREDCGELKKGRTLDEFFLDIVGFDVSGPLNVSVGRVHEKAEV